MTRTRTITTLILAINPGRLGAGVTNIAFTDPVHLERDCGIANDFPKREELSAQRSANADLRDALGEVRALVLQLQQQLQANRP